MDTRDNSTCLRSQTRLIWLILVLTAFHWPKELRELIMMHILNSPDRTLIICGMSSSREGMQKEEVRLYQDQSHRPHLRALNGYPHCISCGRASVRLSQDQQTIVCWSQPALCLFLYGLCVSFICLNV